ncbi:MAG TPA: hypothetical protein PLL06_00285 [Acidobacteriota bacterium]|nr:hypothetical protein [Acidobacteriota bacterium]HNG91300.1 hypothetical protein [Acidobacteriota bacterium]
MKEQIDVRETVDNWRLWFVLRMALAEANPGTHPESTPNVHAAEIILKSLLGEFQVFRDGRPVDIRQVLELYGSKPES